MTSTRTTTFASASTTAAAETGESEKELLEKKPVIVNNRERQAASSSSRGRRLVVDSVKSNSKFYSNLFYLFCFAVATLCLTSIYLYLLINFIQFLTDSTTSYHQLNNECGGDGREGRGDENENDRQFNKTYWSLSTVYIGPSSSSSSSSFCMGALISRRSILASAHCLENIQNKTDNQSNQTKPLYAYFGMRYSREFNKNTTIKKTVSSIIMHDEYDRSDQKNNLAILNLSEPIEFNSRVQSACFYYSPKLSEKRKKMKNSFYGKKKKSFWNIIWDNNQDESAAKKVVHYWDGLRIERLNLLELNSCFSEASSSLNNLICAGNENDGWMSACNSISDGLLYSIEAVNGKWRKFISGIGTLTNYGCEKVTYKTLFTKVDHYKEWIVAKSSSSPM